MKNTRSKHPNSLGSWQPTMGVGYDDWRYSWRRNFVPVVLERFMLPALAAVWVLIVLTNPMQWDIYQRVGGGLAVVGMALFIGATVHRWNDLPKPPPSTEVQEDTDKQVSPTPPPASGPAVAKNEWTTRSLGSVKPFPVPNGDLLILRGPLSIAAIALTHAEMCKGTYAWRHQQGDGSAETRGNGELFEQYATKVDETGKEMGVDVGGRLWVIAGPYKIQWSCRGTDSGWIYPTPSEFEAYRMARTSLEAFRF